jgi:hypothetical protein
MNHQELMREILRGRLLVVGEYRGSYADRVEYVDNKSGEVIAYIKAIHLIECSCRGNLDRATVTERLPEIIETPEEAMFHYLRGSLYAFYLEAFERKQGQLMARILPGTVPLLIEPLNEHDGNGEERGDAERAVRRASVPLSP